MVRDNIKGWIEKYMLDLYAKIAQNNLAKLKNGHQYLEIYKLGL